MPSLKSNFGIIEDTMEIAGALLIVAIIIGGVDLPLFYNVSTTGWGTPNIILWGVITVVSISVLLLLIFEKIKNYQRSGS